VPLNLEIKLEVWDSPNSAGIVIDAVRCCKLALNDGVGGQLDGPSSYLMKSPHNQRPDNLAREETEKFIAKHTRRAATRPKGRTAPPKAATQRTASTQRTDTTSRTAGAPRTAVATRKASAPRKAAAKP
jgi:myo-inositol-1-phosphate synthase